MNRYYVAISERANHRCEYCQAPEVVFNFPFEVEHIIPLSRQGTNDEGNLALACRSCNLRKGNRTSGYAPDSKVEIPSTHLTWAATAVLFSLPSLATSSTARLSLT